jgi:tetratricopeptide (TPR) repeat protein
MAEVVDYLRTVARASARSRSERWAEAAALWAQVVERNPVNGNHWDRLAEARFGVGDCQGALAAYEKVLELGVWERHRETVFPAEVVYRMACCHARLGDRKRALEALAEALELGYRDLERLRSDDHLASLRDEQRFSELAGPDPHEVEGLPRDQGWRGDLRLLAREVRRRASIPLRGFPERRFDAAVDDLSRSVPGLSDTQIAIELMKLLRPLGDGHASVEVPEENQDFHRALPLQFYLFEEGMFVTAAEPAHASLLGAQVLHLDQQPLSEVMAALEPLISRDNQQWPKQAAPPLLRQLPLLHALGVVADPGAVTLTVRRADGTTGAVTVAASSALSSSSRSSWTLPCPAGWVFLPETLPSPVPLYLRNCGASYWFEYLPDPRVVYFQFNGVADDADEPLEAFCGRLFDLVAANPVDKLVIDLRWNGGGNTFLVGPLLHRLVGCDKVNRRGRLFVVIGRRTFSAAQNTATFIERHTNAVFVGEPTGSRPNFVGETAPFRLPYSKLEVNVSDLYWQSSWPMDHRAWIAPELYAPPSFEAYRANRDPAMEAILACREHLPGW